VENTEVEEMKEAKALLKMVSPYLTVGTLYILSDVLFDFGLVTIPKLYAFCLLATRYGAVVNYSLAKLYLKYQAHNAAPTAFRDRNPHEPFQIEIGVSFPQREYQEVNSDE
jgi:hypothetical protein